MDEISTTRISVRSLVNLQISFWSGFVLLAVIGFGMMRLFAPELTPTVANAYETVFDSKFFFYIAAGFVAQLIDGALGMAYGITSTSLLLSAGISPAVASASVHAAEVFTTGVSGLSHWKFGNIDKRLLMKLALPGALGAALGACILTSFDGSVIKPYVSAYLLMMGLLVLRKAVRRETSFQQAKSVRLLALIGGFVDSSGGGGWGPVVTSTLIGTGKEPRTTIGTVNTAEFLVALTASAVLSSLVGLSGWQVVVGLILGGILAAPSGAYLCQRINAKACMFLVGLLIIFLSVKNLGFLF
jgi:uncharacterized membrane protein YfcA